MITIDNSEDGVMIVAPHGALTREDLDQLTAAFDTRVNETDEIPNLVIRADQLPHWDSLDAMTRHFHFVKTHHKIIQKVAVVGDSPVLSLAPEIADHIVSAKVRHFPADRFEEAKQWAQSEADDPGRFETIEGLPSDVIAMRAVGVITPDDYRETLEPLVEEKLKQHDILKCLIVLDDRFTAYPFDAMWEDTKFGFKHMRDFSRIAMVTNVGWLAKGARILMPLLPYDFKLFTPDQLEEAKSWIKR